ELTAYIEAHGDALVRQKYTTPTRFNLGTWVSNRRRDFKAGRLSPQRAAALDEIGFVWDARVKVRS
ncbi:MAG TPA: helicase associated domain-containing protein, partial [Solirubrobacteraceae bacterium]|nr:helicase associated domain-containing protein [Solirubrobacteraceae bacterium]